MGDLGKRLRGDGGAGDGGWVCLVDGYCGGCVDGADLVVRRCFFLLSVGIVRCIFGRGIGGGHCDLIVKVEKKKYIDSNKDSERRVG